MRHRLSQRDREMIDNFFYNRHVERRLEITRAMRFRLMILDLRRGALSGETLSHATEIDTYSGTSHAGGLGRTKGS